MVGIGDYPTQTNSKERTTAMKPDKELVKEWCKELGFESIHEMTKARFNELMKRAYLEGQKDHNNIVKNWFEGREK